VSLAAAAAARSKPILNDVSNMRDLLQAFSLIEPDRDVNGHRPGNERRGTFLIRGRTVFLRTAQGTKSLDEKVIHGILTRHMERMCGPVPPDGAFSCSTTLR
jgi:hypothetical protein